METTDCIDDLGVEIIDDFVWEVSLEQMAEFIFEFNLKTISYEKTRKGDMLIGTLSRSGDRMIGSLLISRFLIINTIYCFVDGYKRLIVYDPIHKNTLYTDENEDTVRRYESTHTFAVTSYPHFLVKIAAQCIENKLEEKERQGVSEK